MILSFLLELVSGLFVQFLDLVELLHVLKEVWTALKGDEKLGFLAVASLVVSPVVRGLNCDGLGSDLLECSVIVPKQKVSNWPKNKGARNNTTIATKLLCPQFL